MKKIWVISLVLALIVALHLRTRSLTDPHTMAYDTEGMLKFAKQIVEEGKIPDFEPLRYAGYFEKGWDNREILPVTPFVIAALSFGQPHLVKQAAMWYPAILGILSIVLVAYIGKELFGYPGLMAGALLGVAPGYVFRTTAGFNDKEAAAMFLMMLGIYFYVIALKKKSFMRSLLSGICFGIAALTWGGYKVFLVPLALFTTLLVLLGKKKMSLIYLPILIFFLIGAPRFGFKIIESYQGLLILGVAGYVIIDYYLGNVLAKKFKSIIKSIKQITGSLEDSTGIKFSEKAVLSGLVTFGIGILALSAMGRDPILTFSTLGAYLKNPIRGALHARSVGEQAATTWGNWRQELDILQIAFPLTFIINPTQSLFNMIIASLPLILVVAWEKKWRWEYLFVSVWAFFSNFTSATIVRLFFPLMPAACLSMAGVIAYLLSRKEELMKQVALVVPVLIFLMLWVSATDISKRLHTSLDPLWYQGLVWYKYNSQPLSPIATWWDYGYWIFNIADRPSLADGSNAYYTADVDLGWFFTETNQTAAVNYLKSKNTKHVIMDGSMVNKFYWVSSIGRKGEANATTYPQFMFKQEADTEQGKARVYQAYSGEQVVALQDQILIGRQDVGYLPIRKIATQKGYMVQVKNKSIPSQRGALVLTSNVAIYINPAAEDMMFTRLYFMQGAGLDKFEDIFDNGYIKTYRVNW